MKTSQTNWAAIDAMEDKDIDLSDSPEVTPEQFSRAIVRKNLKPVTKSQVTLRVDADVLAWFKSQGKGYQTHINSLLKAYMEANIKQVEN